MDKSGREHKLTAAVLCLCAAVSIALAVFAAPFGARPVYCDTSGSPWPPQFAAEASPLVFLCSCVLVFFRPRFGYILGLIAGLAALAWLALAEFEAGSRDTWAFLNQTGSTTGSSWFHNFVIRRILSAGLATTAVACASLRLFPGCAWVFDFATAGKAAQAERSRRERRVLKRGKAGTAAIKNRLTTDLQSVGRLPTCPTKD